MFLLEKNDFVLTSRTREDVSERVREEGEAAGGKGVQEVGGVGGEDAGANQE